MSRQNLTIVLAERPHGEVVPGKTFHQKEVTVPGPDELKDGQFLVETLYLSLDPAMRGWLDDERSYVPPVEIGSIMRGAAIVRVLATRSSHVKQGDVLVAYTGWQEYAVLDDKAEGAAYQPPVELEPGVEVTDLLGFLGMTGMTAYFGMTKIGEPQKGESVVVSGAAGATGSVAAQIAKAKGARVIGIAGSPDKVRWLKDDLGLDVALNYKDKDFKKQLEEATPSYIDVFYDNVGGEILDLALDRAAKYSRFIMCGHISQYNATEKQGPKNIFKVVQMRIKMQGFIVSDYAKEFPAARKELSELARGGKLKSKVTIKKGGLKAAEEGLLDLFKGANIGKLLVEVKDPKEEAKL